METQKNLSLAGIFLTALSIPSIITGGIAYGAAQGVSHFMLQDAYRLNAELGSMEDKDTVLEGKYLERAIKAADAKTRLAMVEEMNKTQLEEAEPFLYDKASKELRDELWYKLNRYSLYPSIP